jgi:hypothetical protein
MKLHKLIAGLRLRLLRALLSRTDGPDTVASGGAGGGAGESSCRCRLVPGDESDARREPVTIWWENDLGDRNSQPTTYRMGTVRLLPGESFELRAHRAPGFVRQARWILEGPPDAAVFAYCGWDLASRCELGTPWPWGERSGPIAGGVYCPPDWHCWLVRREPKVHRLKGP